MSSDANTAPAHGDGSVVGAKRSPPPFPPVEVRSPSVAFPDPSQMIGGDVVAISRTLAPELVVDAYRKGVFPWPFSEGIVPWVSPSERAVFDLAKAPAWGRSLRKVLRSQSFTVTFNERFDDVIGACASLRAGATWITSDVNRTYCELHRLGWAHSIEVWNREGRLAGGLYGIIVGASFAGESMFHYEPNASKIAFVALVERLRERGFEMLDAQVPTEHLLSLGCEVIDRDEFLQRLRRARDRLCRFD